MRSNVRVTGPGLAGASARSGTAEVSWAGCLEQRVEGVTAWLMVLDTSAAGVEDLERGAAVVRGLQRVAAGLLARIGVRANELAELGLGPGAAGVLAGEGEVSSATARDDEARAEVVRSLPVFGAALSSGAIGADHVDVVAGLWARGSMDERAGLAASDRELAEAALRLSVASFQRQANRIMGRLRSDLGIQAVAKEAEVRLWWGRDNMGRLAGRLTPEQYERVSSALEAEKAELVRDNVRSAEAADDGRFDGTEGANGTTGRTGGIAGEDGSLGESGRPPDGDGASVALDGRLAAEALVNRVTGHGRGRVGRPAVTIVVDAATVANGPHDAGVCETESGGQISPEALARCACDAVVRAVTLDDRGVPIAVGRAQRTATDAQWAALKALYVTCAWSGCGRPVGWCQAHHVVFWDHLGPTDLANLVPLCSHHHHLVHEGGWRLVLHADRRLDHIRPDGVPWRTAVPDRLTGRGRSAATPATKGPGSESVSTSDGQEVMGSTGSVSASDGQADDRQGSADDRAA